MQILMIWNQLIVSDDNQYIDFIYFTARKLVKKAAGRVDENILSDKDWWKKILVKKQTV